MRGASGATEAPSTPSTSASIRACRETASTSPVRAPGRSRAGEITFLKLNELSEHTRNPRALLRDLGPGEERGAQHSRLGEKVLIDGRVRAHREQPAHDRYPHGRGQHADARALHAGRYMTAIARGHAPVPPRPPLDAGAHGARQRPQPGSGVHTRVGRRVVRLPGRARERRHRREQHQAAQRQHAGEASGVQQRARSADLRGERRAERGARLVCEGAVLEDPARVQHGLQQRRCGYSGAVGGAVGRNWGAAERRL
eukprot:1189350-Prorocentrum_minimum.AAC.2